MLMSYTSPQPVGIFMYNDNGRKEAVAMSLDGVAAVYRNSVTESLDMLNEREVRKR
jgi:hypothetical protein